MVIVVENVEVVIKQFLHNHMVISISSISKAKWLHYSGALNLYASEVHISKLHKPPQTNREFEIEFFQHCLAQVHQVLRTGFCHDNFLVQAFNEVAQCFRDGQSKSFHFMENSAPFPSRIMV